MEETTEDLAKRGLKRVIVWVVLYWRANGGFTSSTHDTEEEAIKYRVFGDFAGYSEHEAIIPIDPAPSEES